MKHETQTWLNIADQDLAAAQGLLDLDLYAPTIFHCQQAVEKYLKGIWAETHTDGVPPKVHDLVELLNGLDFDLPDKRRFLSDLSRQAVSTRYDNHSEFPRALAVEVLQESRVLCEQLRLRLT